jgi:hypothetical protein
MAVPNYTYLKLKMLGPNGVITVVPSYEHAYECDVECVEHGEAILESATLAANLNGLANEIPDPKHHAGNFEPTKDVKLIPLDPTDPKGKALSISPPVRRRLGPSLVATRTKGRARKRIPRAPPGARKGTTTRRRKTSRANKRPRPMTMLPPLIVRNLEDPPTGAFSTKCSKNHVPTTKGPQTTTSRTATCSGDTLKA